MPQIEIEKDKDGNQRLGEIKINWRGGIGASNGFVREGSTFGIPDFGEVKEGEDRKLWSLQNGKQFVFANTGGRSRYSLYLFFGKDEQSFFLTPISEIPVIQLERAGEKAFYKSFIPRSIRVARETGREIMRQGDWYMADLGLSLEQAVAMVDLRNGIDFREAGLICSSDNRPRVYSAIAHFQDDQNRQSLIDALKIVDGLVFAPSINSGCFSLSGTRHVLTGIKLQGIKGLNHREEMPFFIGTGLLEAPDHSLRALPRPHLIMQSLNLIEPQRRE